MRLFPALLLLVACASSPRNAFDEAEQLTISQQQNRVRDLYRIAADSDPDPLRREKAAIRAANLEWRVFHDAAAARSLLDRVSNADSWLQRAQMELELNHDHAAARAAAAKASSLAETREERQKSMIARAAVAVSDRNPEALKAAIADLLQAIEEAGPRTETSRLLLKAALLANDDALALRALRWYYADVPALVPATVPDRESLGRALANARLFAEAAMALNDPDVDEYAAAIERVEMLANELYRATAVGKGDLGAFRKALAPEAQALWAALSWPGKRPPFSMEALAGELDRRFGAVITIGQTDKAPSMHYGHRVLDEQRSVEQYGRKGSLRFVLLDGVVSNGYMAWIREGAAGAGGWTADDGTIYQIRPMYADGPARAWRRLTDPELRAKDDQEIADETKRDAQRAATQRIRPFPGLDLRLRRQYGEGLRASLAAQGLGGEALRDAFIARYRSEVFDTSIWAHEGRHSIDKTQFGIRDNADLEFRAKLSEIAFAPSPRLPLTSSILRPIGDGTPHGEANKRVLQGILRRTNLRDLTQLDQLTDEQLREVARSMDPLSKP